MRYYVNLRAALKAEVEAVMQHSGYVNKTR